MGVSGRLGRVHQGSCDAVPRNHFQTPAARVALPGDAARWRLNLREGATCSCARALAVTALDVFGGLWVLRVEEKLFGAAMFDQFAQEHEDAFIAGPARLCHVVGHDDDGVTAFEDE